MLIHTSASGHVWPITANPPAAYLYDFDIDGDKLKPDHKKWLDQNVVDTLNKSAMEEWNLFLEGTASYTGDKTYNEGLSGRRAVEVYKYLLSKVSGKHLYHQMSAFGYRNASMAGKKFGVEDERDRTVTVLVQEKTKPPPPPIPHPKLVIPVLVPKIPMPKVSGFGYGPWGIKGFSSFTLTAPLIGVISAGGGTGVLQLENVDAKKVATYHMSGPVGALGFDLKKIPFIGSAIGKLLKGLKGKGGSLSPSGFTTHGSEIVLNPTGPLFLKTPVLAEDFAGSVTITSLGVAAGYGYSGSLIIFGGGLLITPLDYLSIKGVGVFASGVLSIGAGVDTFRGPATLVSVKSI